MPNACLLVAEDNSCVRQLIVRTLKLEGYCILEASDGAEALKLIRQDPTRINLLITDVHMPHLSGHELARLVRPTRPDLPILILSSDGPLDFPPGAIYHTKALTKPVLRDVLVSTVQELLSTDY